MFLLDVLLNGVVLGGMYALTALGLNLQYGVARIMNLSYGEFLMIAAFISFLLFTSYGLDPLLGMAISVPVMFVANWLIYQIFLFPLVRRAKSRDALEGDTILVTFGLLFLIQGGAMLEWGAQYRGYAFLAVPVHIGAFTFALNRLVAFAAACVIGIVAFVILRFTRTGTALRALAVDPRSAELVAIDVRRYNALAFACGGGMVAAAGTLISMFLSFNPTIGISFTLKALIVMVMGGIGNMAGSLLAGVILGVAESVGAYLVDPGLTLAINYAMFILVVLLRPNGLFARA
jgi:branched-chain amino acid transport system permease protein